ncbi:hypothetical protein HF086_000092 [Spodoptera exigua]|uniref:Uncharacterized protein n=1 Tax=Spodoptera exigua TaxID=7107 RepID=A0A922MVI1_SPOEX|nr:hypothetical protein HF086_000092 [Spodoptera exigua]
MVDGLNGANMSDEEDSSPDRALGPTNNVPGLLRYKDELSVQKVSAYPIYLNIIDLPFHHPFYFARTTLSLHTSQVLHYMCKDV